MILKDIESIEDEIQITRYLLGKNSHFFNFINKDASLHKDPQSTEITKRIAVATNCVAQRYKIASPKNRASFPFDPTRSKESTMIIV